MYRIRHSDDPKHILFDWEYYNGRQAIKTVVNCDNKCHFKKTKNK